MSKSMRLCQVVIWTCASASVANGEPGNTDRTPIRILEKEVTVRASLDQVWDAWTTSDGLSSFFSTKNNVELRVGGPYELFLNVPPDKNGKRGGQGCKVLSFLPNEMLSFEWGFRSDIPSLRYAGAKTYVVLRFDSSGNGTTRIRLAQLGWGKGRDWDKGYEYFDKEWGETLEALRSRYDKLGRQGSGGEQTGTSQMENRMKHGMIKKLTPMLAVERIEPSLEFWTNKLDFRNAGAVGEKGALDFVMLERDGIEIMYLTRASLQEDATNLGAAATQGTSLLLIEVDNIEQVIANLDGVEIIKPKHDEFYGMTEITIREPGGHLVTFAAKTKK